jgi:hypothetical protein
MSKTFFITLLRSRAVLLAAWLLLAGIGYSGTYSGGAGTSVDPYQIANIADWEELGNTAGDQDGECFIVTADIDFTSGAGGDGTADAVDAIAGTFDGDGHVFQNFACETGANTCALFGTVASGGLVKDLIILNGTAAGNQVSEANTYTGIIAGQIASGGQVDNCDLYHCTITHLSDVNTTGAPVEYHLVGMVSGANHGNVTNCNVFGGSISASNTSDTYPLRIGGIVGYQTYTGGVQGKTEDCYSSATLSDLSGSATVKSVELGGICGGTSTSATLELINRCVFEGTIDYTSSYHGKWGGIVGSVSGYLTNCSARGSMTLDAGSDNDAIMAGGIAGYTYAASISQCSADMIITITDNAKNCDVGGAIGQNTTSSSITDCFVTGAIYDTAATPTGFRYEGGFMGWSGATSTVTRCIAALWSVTDSAFCESSTSTTYTSCFWDSTISGVASDSLTGTTPKTTAELQALGIVSGWTNWKQSSGYYPILDWQTYQTSSLESSFGTGGGSGGMFKSGLYGN